jgi:hypothetical protein
LSKWKYITQMWQKAFLKETWDKALWQYGCEWGKTLNNYCSYESCIIILIKSRKRWVKIYMEKLRNACKICLNEEKKPVWRPSADGRILLKFILNFV